MDYKLCKMYQMITFSLTILIILKLAGNSFRSFLAQSGFSGDSQDPLPSYQLKLRFLLAVRLLVKYTNSLLTYDQYDSCCVGKDQKRMQRSKQIMIKVTDCVAKVYDKVRSGILKPVGQRKNNQP
ncbi:hypothetical protein BD560DRAFT_491756 [Blakeslea trispora]|nr:hypothetical protein BD560DRAFT_491756 [Blakeslea trispora]